ncbi:LysE family translocator [Acidocella sp.]|uniref:LysE family translocator n=1 Tax=Acidocella sp. TaxID=50710 RepID=UPI003D026BF4
MLAFIATAALLTVTPGVDTAMVLRACASADKRPAWHVAMGICIGCLAWGTAVALGIGAILKTAPLAYMMVKYAGAVYLLWMGWSLISNPRKGLEQEHETMRRDTNLLALRRGLFTNLLNPKIGVFYLTFLPQFVPDQAYAAMDIFTLALIHAILTLLWFTILISAISPLRHILRQPYIVGGLDRLAGSIFILFGLKLVLSRA